MMKSRSKKSVALTAVLLVFVFLHPLTEKAASENSLRLYNVIGNATLTLLKGVIQGKVKSFGDAARTMFYGSAAGYGFYQAKKMAGRGHITPGILLANLSASVSENAALGRHPLSYIGYTLGPARLEIATPFAKNPRAILNLAVYPGELLKFYNSLKESSAVQFRNGMITFVATEPIQAKALGWTRGVYPTVLDNHQRDYVFSHETVHVIQQLQSMSLSPEPSPSDFRRGVGEARAKFFRFAGVKWNFLGLGADLFASKLQPYKTNIYEVEAYHFAEK